MAHSNMHPLSLKNYKAVYADGLYRSDADVDKPKEECGVFACYSKDRVDISQIMYYGLQALQHRGQESAGIAIYDSKTDSQKIHKQIGTVVDIFNQDIIASLQGNMGVGHTRYSTVGGSGVENIQPMSIAWETGGECVLAHNGTINNANALRELIEDAGGLFSSNSDTEVILQILSSKVRHGLQKAFVKTASLLQGSYSLVAMVQGKIIGVRDPFGIRPLVIGKFSDNSYLISSETCAFDVVGAEYIRDVKAGEIIIIDEDGIHSELYSEVNIESPCAFEQIYFSRPDSIMGGNSIYRTRLDSGKLLFAQSPQEADIVLGVPQSGVPSALGYAEASGIPYEMGIVKNQMAHRSFINPTQEMREQEISIKFNIVSRIVKNKRLIVIDDSLVRGNTSKRLLHMLRKAGASAIHFMLASPPVYFPCYFGIDISKRSELAANHMSLEKLAKEIGADSLTFLSLDNLKKAFQGQSHCFGCFTGIYPTFAPHENFA